MLQKIEFSMRRRTSLPGTIKKEADGTFTVRVATHANGEYLSKRRRGLLSQWEAKATLKEFQEWLVQAKSMASVITWDRALNEYLDHVTRTSASPNSYKTIYDKKTALLAHTRDWLEISIHEFYGEMVEVRLAEAFAEAGIENQTKNKIVSYVRDVFAH